MSTGRSIWPVEGDPLRHNPSRAAQPRPAEAGLERFMWYFMRISGLLLVFLALGHMLIMHVLVQLFGQEVSFAFVTSRWGTPFWRIYDLLLLMLALVHGVNGGRVIIADYTAGGVRTFLVWLLLLSSFGLLVVGIFVVLTFQPAATLDAGWVA